MRALFLTRLYPYPVRSGGLSYTSSLISAFSERIDHLDVLCNTTESMDPPPEPRANVHWHLVPRPTLSRLKAITSRLPGECVRYVSKEYLQKLGDLAKTRYDLVLIDHFGMGFALNIILQNNCPIVYVSHNFETSVRKDVALFSSRNPLKMAYGLIDAAKVAPLEARLVRRSTLVTAISQNDVASFDTIEPNKSVLISPTPSVSVEQDRSITASTPKRVLLYGSMEWQAKSESLVRFLEKAAPAFQAAGIHLDVVGRATTSAQRAMNRHQDWLTHHGFIPDVRPIRLNSRLGLMIDQVGGGFKTKLLDYFFWRVPVVGLATQMNGLPSFESGKDWFAEKSIEDLTIRVVEVIEDEHLLNEIQQNAFERASKLFSEAARSAQFDDLMNRVSLAVH